MHAAFGAHVTGETGQTHEVIGCKNGAVRCDAHPGILVMLALHEDARLALVRRAMISSDFYSLVAWFGGSFLGRRLVIRARWPQDESQRQHRNGIKKWTGNATKHRPPREIRLGR